MTRCMLIDASYPEETRLAILHDRKLEEFDSEKTEDQEQKGDIFLAKVVRVEPSLQAAFVDFGDERHGFLPLSDIHPDYFRIPVADREALAKAVSGGDQETENFDDEESPGEAARRRMRFLSGYRIQEVVQRGRMMLVQVAGEARGGKGAPLTTYLSLAGRYCVFMPNADCRGGVSRKVTDPKERKRLKEVLQDLQVPAGAAVIVRTIGSGRRKTEIRRDYEYLGRLWNQIRETTLSSTAPTRIHQEAGLVKRALRDLYDRDTETVWVEGKDAYKEAREFMKTLSPSYARRIKLHHSEEQRLFHQYGIEQYIERLYQPVVELPSGGYLVIESTEALTSIDVNSGRATRNRDTETTAFKTNMEASQEVARHLRLRNLGGLVVIDFIDMEQSAHNREVERCFREVLSFDRARTQVGKISNFGLLEMTRQRLRRSLREKMLEPCRHCQGAGYTPRSDRALLRLVRALERAPANADHVVRVSVSRDLLVDLFNTQRAKLTEVENLRSIRILVAEDSDMQAGNFSIASSEADKTSLEKKKNGYRRGRIGPEQKSRLPANEEQSGSPSEQKKPERTSDPSENTEHATRPNDEKKKTANGQRTPSRRRRKPRAKSSESQAPASAAST